MVDEAQPRLVTLPTREHRFGDLTFIDAGGPVPFEPRRVYFVRGIPEDAVRGGHAHRTNQELVVALEGSFDVKLESVTGRAFHFHLDDPRQGLWVPPLHWRVLQGYSPGAICLVVASEPYDEAEYVRDYGEFLASGPASP